ncbi:hypothetical protein XF36_13245 [Pseudonocardia sp. HH130629-09]|nr:hypothetical protein [Pseudonocardia sp. HH130629-09]ALE83992.1 hypothetical protein XF36_13245 [Pseudonocardia sp. HH130629-09]
MQGDDQPGRGGRGEDRPEHRVTPAQIVATHREQHLHEARVVRPVLDLGVGRRRVTERHGDRLRARDSWSRNRCATQVFTARHRAASNAWLRLTSNAVVQVRTAVVTRPPPGAGGVEDGGAQGRHVVRGGALDHRGRVGTGLDGSTRSAAPRA